jgi:hypothetical protein
MQNREGKWVTLPGSYKKFTGRVWAGLTSPGKIPEIRREDFRVQGEVEIHLGD